MEQIMEAIMNEEKLALMTTEYEEQKVKQT